MLDGGQQFVLIIIGMAMFAGVMKSAIAAKHGQPMWGPPHWKQRERAARKGYSLEDNSGEVERLKSENRRLTDQVETMQDRLVVLERIVTDRGYGLANEIEALRDTKPVSRKEVQ
ncbi:MAG TPA: hypothetical protein VIC34_12515 [Croceibacterium sp.]|jgi:predicted RNase H-like nuclease (RuvC/YqgF family)